MQFLFASFTGHDPWTVAPWWGVPHMLAVTAFKLRNPIAVVILVKTDDFLFHVSRPHVPPPARMEPRWFGSLRRDSDSIPFCGTDVQYGIAVPSPTRQAGNSPRRHSRRRRESSPVPSPNLSGGKPGPSSRQAGNSPRRHSHRRRESSPVPSPNLSGGKPGPSSRQAGNSPRCHSRRRRESRMRSRSRTGFPWGPRE